MLKLHPSLPYILGLLVLLTLLYMMCDRHVIKDAFTPIVPDLSPMAKQQAQNGSDVTELNACWRKILGYLETNPMKAVPLIDFMRSNFFNPSCALRQPRIDVAHLADKYQPIFT